MRMEWLQLGAKNWKGKSHKGIWWLECPGSVPGINSGRPRDNPGRLGRLIWKSQFKGQNVHGTDGTYHGTDGTCPPGQTGFTPGGVPPKFFNFHCFFLSPINVLRFRQKASTTCGPDSGGESWRAISFVMPHSPAYEEQVVVEPPKAGEVRPCLNVGATLISRTHPSRDAMFLGQKMPRKHQKWLDHYTQHDYRTKLYYFRIIFGNFCSGIPDLKCFWNCLVSVGSVSRGLPNPLPNCFRNSIR